MLKHLAETAAEKSLWKSPQSFRAEHRGGQSGPASGRWRRAVEHRAGPKVLADRCRTAQIEGDATLFDHHHPRHLCRNHHRQSFPKENPWGEVDRIFCLKFNLFNSKPTEKNIAASILALVTTTSTAFSGSKIDIASIGTHSAFNFIEKPSVLINYESSYDQEVFPHIGCRGPRLEIFITADAKITNNLNRILLIVKVGI